MTAIADSAGGAGETVLVAGGQDWQQVVAHARRSITIAMPWPPPTHMVSRPNVLS